MASVPIRVASPLLAALVLAGCGGSPPAAEPAPRPPVAVEAPEETVSPAGAPASGVGAPGEAPGAPAPMASGTPRSPSIPLDSPEDDGRAGEATTLDGIYTGAQARRGLGVYRQICSDCHDPADWQDEAFLARWNGESVYRFWYYIYEQMPEGEPPYTLSREQVTDVVTYILQLNALPEGPSELGPDEDSIDDHWLYWGPAP